MVDLVVNGDSIAPKTIVDILTRNVAKFLPPDWKDVSSHDKAISWLESRINDGDVFSVLIQENMECIGFIFLHGITSEKAENEVRLGYLISEKYWGKGVASELVGALIEFCKKKGNVGKIIGGVSPKNIGSVKVLTKNNFYLASREQQTDYYEYKF